MAFKIIQIQQINTGDFVFSSPVAIPNPIAPLVSTVFYTPENGALTLKIRATLYINSKKSKEGKTPKVKDPVETGNSLKLVFKYDFDSRTLQTCDVWYVELDYTSDTVAGIAKIVSFLKDSHKEDDLGSEVEEDPTTSRGTETSSRYP